jgi:hypothetical protein
MKISQEVRDFARLNPTPVRPEVVEGLPSSSLEREENRASTGSARTELEEAESPALSDAERGMAEMSKRFHDGGSELYVPAE